MSTRSHVSSGAAIAFVVVGSLTLAGPVLAFPPGTDPVVRTAALYYSTGQPVPVTITYLAPGCPVTITVTKDGQTIGRWYARSGANGVASSTVPGLSAAGSYMVTAQGFATATTHDCATPAVVTTVVVPSGDPGTAGSPDDASADDSPLATFRARVAEASSAVATFFSQNPRVRTASLIALAAAVSLLVLAASRRRHRH